MKKYGKGEKGKRLKTALKRRFKNFSFALRSSGEKIMGYMWGRGEGKDRNV